MEIKKPEIDLFIVGAAKSGTTSLYNYLSRHPDTFFPSVKEPNYYSKAESHNPSAYFPPKKGEFYHNKIIRDENIYHSIFDGAEKFSLVAEASPSYLWDESSATRIYNDYPNAKILIILRNPVERAFSQYLMDIRDGRQHEESFLEALKNDAKQKNKVWGRAHLYQELGLYYAQVERYLALFKGNTKVLIYEEFMQDVRSGLIDILEFLDIDREKVDLMEYEKVHNSYKVPSNFFMKFLIQNKNKALWVKNIVPVAIKRIIKENYLFSDAKKPLMSDMERRYLKGIFEEDIKKLEVLLGRKIDVW